jgi:RimJ/RimL family protein N-acetyltransferase
MTVSLRRADVEYIWLIYKWRNHLDIRRKMFSTKSITKKEHAAFWEKRLASGAHSFIIVANGKPCGLLRLDEEKGYSEVGLMVAPAMQGKGIGTAALVCLVKKAKKMGICRLKARVRDGNDASVRTFLGCGFEKVWKGKTYAVFSCKP